MDRNYENTVSSKKSFIVLYSKKISSNRKFKVQLDKC